MILRRLFLGYTFRFRSLTKTFQKKHLMQTYFKISAVFIMNTSMYFNNLKFKFKILIYHNSIVTGTLQGSTGTIIEFQINYYFLNYYVHRCTYDILFKLFYFISNKYRRINPLLRNELCELRR